MLLAFACFCAATLYASVGHAGASAYLAVMALLAVEPASMKPTALALNLCVATIGTLSFGRVGAVPWRALAGFLLGSVPCAFLAAKLPVAPSLFKLTVAAALVLGAVRLLWLGRAVEGPDRPPPLPVAVGVGAVVGVLAGVTGTGGGVFLTPVALFLGWFGARRAAGLSAAFILANSAAGLLSRPDTLAHLPDSFGMLVVAVVMGGLIGATLGSSRFDTVALRRALAAVLLVAVGKLVL